MEITPDARREIVDRLRPHDRGRQTAVLGALVHQGLLTKEQASDLLFALLMAEVGIPVRHADD